MSGAAISFDGQMIDTCEACISQQQPCVSMCCVQAENAQCLTWKASIGEAGKSSRPVAMFV